MQPKSVICALALSFALSFPALAGPITYQGTLSDGVMVTGTLSPSSTVDDPEYAHYWSFSGVGGSTVTITGYRLESGLDPAFHVFGGVFSDTSVFSGNLFNVSSLAFGDDDFADSFGGPWDDPKVTIVLPTTGLYTIAFVSFASAPSADGWDYSLVADGIVNPVPELARTLSLLATALIGLGAVRRRR